MSNTTGWRPLLTGARAVQAQGIIEDIDASVRRSAEGPPSASTPTKKRHHPWRLLLPAYRWAADHQREDDATYVGEELARLVANTTDAGQAVRLFDGMGSLTWLHAHLANEVFVDDEEGDEPDADDDDQDAATLILERLRRTPPVDYELVSGLVGLGVIGLELVPSPARHQIVTEVLQALLQRSTTDEHGGRYLLTPPTALPAWQRLQMPDGCYNLGVAHGMPGVVALAAECYARGIAPELSTSLASGVVDWLLRIRYRGENAGPGYDGLIEVGTKHAGGDQLAWCYGGLGLSATVLRAAQAFKREDWRQQAIDIAAACAATAQAAVPLRDQGVCHGMAGNGHIFNRLFQATGDERFQQAALAYFEATLDAYQPGTGIGGYQAWAMVSEMDKESASKRRPGRLNDVSLLTGSTGIGLTLLAASSDVEPKWDRVLLLDLAPAASTSQGIAPL